jgi:hypothetical protein
MGRRRVDRDQEVQLGNDGGGIGEIGNVVAQVEQGLVVRRRLGLVLAPALLQAEKAYAGNIP